MRQYLGAIALIALIFCGVAILCIEYDKNSSVTITEEVKIEPAKEFIYDGDYFLFRTKSVHEYFKFLEEFDDTKYEIIDISNSMITVDTTEFYIVTYKVKEIEKDS